MREREREREERERKREREIKCVRIASQQCLAAASLIAICFITALYFLAREKCFVAFNFISILLMKSSEQH